MNSESNSEHRLLSDIKKLYDEYNNFYFDQALPVDMVMNNIRGLTSGVYRIFRSNNMCIVEKIEDDVENIKGRFCGYLFYIVEVIENLLFRIMTTFPDELLRLLADSDYKKYCKHVFPPAFEFMSCWNKRIKGQTATLVNFGVYIMSNNMLSSMRSAHKYLNELGFVIYTHLDPVGVKEYENSFMHTYFTNHGILVIAQSRLRNSAPVSRISTCLYPLIYSFMGMYGSTPSMPVMDS